MRQEQTMITTSTRLAAALALVLSLGGFAVAAESPVGETPHYPLQHPRHVDWSFAGPFGRFEPQQLQRGFQVYREVCSSCHSMSMVPFRTLASETGPKFNEEQVRALAAEYEITDGPDSNGEMFQRPGRPSDYFPAPYPNEAAARAANGGAYPPDLSLMAKARAVSSGFPRLHLRSLHRYQESGADYSYSLLTGYEEEMPAGVEMLEGQYYNPYFISGPGIAMPRRSAMARSPTPRTGDESPENDVPETVDQYSKDVVAYLAWAAEPHMVERKSLGLVVMIFLIVLAGLVYYTKKKVWVNSPGEGAY
jgi:ubiquinol-cytochrome c reductase cytochrome c1 subunit